LSSGSLKSRNPIKIAKKNVYEREKLFRRSAAAAAKLAVGHWSFFFLWIFFTNGGYEQLFIIQLVFVDIEGRKDSHFSGCCEKGCSSRTKDVVISIVDHNNGKPSVARITFDPQSIG
jgi:hypothetical protein